MTTYPLPSDPVTAFTRANGTTEPHGSVDHGRIIHIWENVWHHGARADGASDDTAKFQAARDACDDGGMILVPPGHYKVSNLDWTRNVTIQGSGYWNTANVAFGNAAWGSGNYGTNFGGTVIRCTDTTTRGLLANTSGKRVDLRDFMLLGPGSGTSTGIEVGTVANGYQGTMRNICVANFAKGYAFNFAEDCTFDHLSSRGCSTGISLANATNQNTWLQTEVQFSTVKGIDIQTGNTMNRFVGGLLQNCTGTGINVSGTANCVDGFYFENASITRAVDFPNDGSSSNSLQNSYMSTAADAIRTAQVRTMIANIRHGVGYALDVIYPNATSCFLINCDGATLTDGGANTINIQAGTMTRLGSSDIRIGDAGYKVGFYGTAPVLRPAAYTVTNPTTDRGLNVTADTLPQVAEVLGTLIADLQSLGLIG